MKNLDIINEDIKASVLKYVDIVKGFLENRI